MLRVGVMVSGGGTNLQAIEIPVKMLVTCARTERPHGALL